jgi:hypothetical protein
MLNDNTEILRQKGYFYPKLTGITSHYIAYYFGLGASPTLSDFNQKNSRTEHEAFIRDRIHAQIKGNENIILSSEAFSSAIKKEDISKLTAFKIFFPNWNFVIIAYLRRQDHFIESSFNQRGKTRGNTNDIYKYADNGNFDWYKMLKNYSTVFGKENIIVRLFEKTAFSEHSLYHDFLNVLSIRDHCGFIFPITELNMKFNEDIMSIIRHCPEADSKQIVTLLQKIEKNNTRSYDLLSPKKRIEILKKYELSNQKVALEYLGKPDGQLFNEPWPDPNERWEDYEGLTIEKTISIMLELITQQRNRMELLSKKFDHRKKQNTQ